ncbi:anthranilate 1,2-dioxygenase electron transfer component AntC [Marinobacterium sedimentorum]|uniref:anthranilate 1,2-dioxygenase electron transfer component AntC n=1 Tax=Marinobacterium sedimentorum TaxID=2927804 RepID=UPI0020C5C2BF|nr:anthranilate 1,2-dioxygenase electron transfer component AntC [Marinobacterium sedimentorum]MCP8689710.1 anthranilate 1,2-dioxygenase electron transfer component AntC [Marinobacterium sedimentorum]
MHKVALSFTDGRTHFVGVNANEPLLDAALRQGITLPVDCREGVCATCKGTCESGDYSLDYVDEDALSEADLARGAVLACQMRVSSDCAVKFDFESTLCTSAGPLEVEAVVQSVEQLSDSTAIVHIDAASLDQQLDFLPGQYAHVQVPGTDQWRSYSFACAPNATNGLQFLIRLLPQGAMSDYLRDRAAPGDQIRLKAPLGAFYLRKVSRPLVLVAGGTGLSAFLGMLDEMAAEPGACTQPVTLFYGVTQAQDLCELERLQRYAERLPGFSYHRIVMRESEDWQGPVGVVTDLFEECHFNDGEVDTYLCGPPPMVEAVKQWLDQRAMANCQVYFEKFSAS